MAKGIRLQPIVSQKAADKIKAVAEENGETISTIINRLIIMQLANPKETAAPNSAPATKTSTTTLRTNLKTIRDRIAQKHLEKEDIERKSGSITFAQQDDLYELYQRSAELRYQLGELLDKTPDQVMQTFYQNELTRLQSDYDYNTDRYEDLTDKGLQDYKEMEERINTLKDRLK